MMYKEVLEFVFGGVVLTFFIILGLGIMVLAVLTVTLGVAETLRDIGRIWKHRDNAFTYSDNEPMATLKNDEISKNV